MARINLIVHIHDMQYGKE